MKQLRKGAVLLLAVLLALAGCSSDGQRFLSALEKTSDAGYYEQQSRMSFALEYSGGDQTFQDSMRSLKHVFAALIFDIDTAYESDSQNGQVKAYINVETSLDPVKFLGEAWLELDLANETPKYDIIARIPALAKALLPEEQAKEYVYIDYFELLDTLAGDIPTASLFTTRSLVPTINIKQKSQDIMDSFTKVEAFGEYFTLSSQVEDGLEKLTLTMSDAQLKGFITALFNELITNEEILDAFVELLSSSVDLSQLLPEAAFDKETLKEFLVSNIAQALPTMEEHLRASNILGSNGLVFELILDEEGFIIHEDMTLTLDLSGMASSIFPYYTGGNPGRAELTIKVAAINSGFNTEGSVEFPTLTAANTLDAVRVIKEQIERDKENRMYYFPYAYYMYDSLVEIADTPRAFPIVGYYNGTKLNSIVHLVNIEKHLNYPSFCITLREAVELFGGKIEWNADHKLALWKFDDQVLVITPRDFEVSAEYFQNDGVFKSESPYIARESLVIDGTTYIGLSDIENFLQLDFGFSEDAQMVLIK